MFLRIVSPVICPIEGFTVLGVSTSRGKEELIGQFGSGNKHAVNVLLRNGINPIIYSGTTRVEFFTKPEQMGETTYSRVFVKVSNRRPERLSMAAEYGEMDWTSIDMALREFVSNAIDAAKGSTKGVQVDVVDRVSPRQGKTVVGVPLTPEVQRWYQALARNFLHFDPKGKQKLQKKVLPKKEPAKGRIYRKGVLVRETQGDVPALFDFNFGDELRIDESRNLDDYSVSTAATEQIAKSEHLEDIFRLLPTSTPFWERNLPDWNLSWGARHNAEHWRATWQKVHGKSIVAMSESVLTEHARHQGHSVVIVGDANWYKAICAAGIDSTLTVLDNVNGKGHIFHEPQSGQRKTYDQVWTWLERAEMTEGKEKPPFRLFEEVMKAETEKLGYYHDSIVYVRSDMVDHHRV